MKVVYVVRSGKCPLCGSTDIRRSRRKGIAEQLGEWSTLPAFRSAFEFRRPINRPT